MVLDKLVDSLDEITLDVYQATKQLSLQVSDKTLQTALSHDIETFLSAYQAKIDRWILSLNKKKINVEEFEFLILGLKKHMEMTYTSTLDISKSDVSRVKSRMIYSIMKYIFRTI